MGEGAAMDISSGQAKELEVSTRKDQSFGGLDYLQTGLASSGKF